MKKEREIAMMKKEYEEMVILGGGLYIHITQCPIHRVV